MLAQAIRDRIVRHPDFGAGNFLNIACELVPDPNRPYLTLDGPRDAVGAAYALPRALSLNDIRRLSAYVSVWYRNRKIKVGARVGIYLTGGADYYWHYLALNNIGAVPVWVNGKLPEKTAAKFLTEVGVCFLVTDEGRVEVMRRHVGTAADVEAVPTLQTGPEWPELSRAELYKHQSDDIVVVCHTSGTTGAPKPVFYRHRSMCYGINEFLVSPPEYVSTPVKGGKCKLLSLLPNAHHSSLTYFMRAILAQIDLMVVTRPAEDTIRDAITAFKPSVVISFPFHYVTLASKELDPGRHSFDSVAWWLSVGDAAHQRHIKRLVRHGYRYKDGKFEPGSTFVDGLGSSEMGSIFFRIPHTTDAAHPLRCIGKPVEWVEATILSEDGNPVESGNVGRLAVRSPTVARYWKKEELEEKSWVNGYLLTGDLAYRDPDGRYFHVDRVSDVIITRGGVLYSTLTEEILLEHFEEFDDCAVVGIPETPTAKYATPILYVISERLCHDDVRSIQVRVKELLSERNIPTIEEVRLATPNDMPIGPTGKIQKWILRHT